MKDNPILVAEAEQFLNSTVFADVLKSLREEAYADIADSKPEETGLREMRYFDLQALDRIRAKLKSYPDNHKIMERMKK